MGGVTAALAERVAPHLTKHDVGHDRRLPLVSCHGEAPLPCQGHVHQARQSRCADPAEGETRDGGRRCSGERLADLVREGVEPPLLLDTPPLRPLRRLSRPLRQPRLPALLRDPDTGVAEPPARCRTAERVGDRLAIGRTRQRREIDLECRETGRINSRTLFGTGLMGDQDLDQQAPVPAVEDHVGLEALERNLELSAIEAEDPTLPLDDAILILADRDLGQRQL